MLREHIFMKNNSIFKNNLVRRRLLIYISENQMSSRVEGGWIIITDCVYVQPAVVCCFS